MPAKKKTTAKKNPAMPVSRGEATRANVVEAAHGLFLKHGFHGTSMRQIADEAGIALGGIYNHFASKEDIFAAVFDAYHPYHVILPALEQIEGDTVEAFVREVAQLVYDEVVGAERQLLPLVFIELVEFQGRHLKQLVAKLMPTFMSFAQRFAERRGQLRDIPPPVVFRTFMGLLVGFFLSEMLFKDTPLLKQNKTDGFGGMVDIYLHGIVEPEG